MEADLHGRGSSNVCCFSYHSSNFKSFTNTSDVSRCLIILYKALHCYKFYFCFSCTLISIKVYEKDLMLCTYVLMHVDGDWIAILIFPTCYCSITQIFYQNNTRVKKFAQVNSCNWYSSIRLIFNWWYVKNTFYITMYVQVTRSWYGYFCSKGSILLRSFK